MLLGGYLSLKQTDLKRILAYSTVSSLGVLVMLLGWNTNIAAEAASAVPAGAFALQRHAVS